jgi:RNase P subunit RPR2
MKAKINKKEAEQKIKDFFSRESFDSGQVRKIKRIAMKFNLKLGKYRKMFCKKCLSQLHGRLRINKGLKTVECAGCGFKNRWKI